MALQRLKNWWMASRSSHVTPFCLDDCPLASCGVGLCATVLGVSCPALEAQRLRTLGVYEGARVSVVDRRSGVLLDVCGTRLALNDAVASSILVRPVAA